MKEKDIGSIKVGDTVRPIEPIYFQYVTRVNKIVDKYMYYRDDYNTFKVSEIQGEYFRPDHLSGSVFKLSEFELVTNTQTKIMEEKQVIIVKGNFSLRNAFVEDLKEAGLGSKLSYAFDPYQKSSNTVIVANHTVNGILAATEDIIKDNPPYKNATTYQLPEDYNKALQAFKDYFQEEVTFRIGDIVVFDLDSAIKDYDTSDVWDRSYILQVESIGVDYRDFLYFSNEEMKAAGMVFPTEGKCANRSKHFRKATPKEVVKHKEQTLIYEAKKRGFKKGVSINQAPVFRKGVHTIKEDKFYYSASLDNLIMGGFGIYQSGKWVDIIVKEITLTLGSKDVLVTINKSGIYAKGESIDPNKLKEFYYVITIDTKLGGWDVSVVDRDTRAIRIGCVYENNLFSLNEIDKVIQEFDSLQ
jgi:hypothetical protein